MNENMFEENRLNCPWHMDNGDCGGRTLREELDGEDHWFQETCQRELCPFVFWNNVTNVNL